MTSAGEVATSASGAEATASGAVALAATGLADGEPLWLLALRGELRWDPWWLPDDCEGEFAASGAVEIALAACGLLLLELLRLRGVEVVVPPDIDFQRAAWSFVLRFCAVAVVGLVAEAASQDTASEMKLLVSCALFVDAPAVDDAGPSAA